MWMLKLDLDLWEVVYVAYDIKGKWLKFLKDLQLIERIQRLATRCVKSFRRLLYPERLNELKLSSMERHFLRATLITVNKLFHDYLNLPVKEFFVSPAAGNLCGHNFKVRLPRFQLARRNAAFAVRSAGPWNRLPSHIAEAPTVSSFKDRLDANWCSIFPDIVWLHPTHCSNVNGFCAQVLLFRPVNLIWSSHLRICFEHQEYGGSRCLHLCTLCWP